MPPPANPFPSSILNMPDEITITELLPEHASAVARLHIDGITTGFISSLGADFVTELYRCVATSEYGFGLVAVRGDKVVGFVAFTTSINALYRSILLKKGIAFAFMLLPRLLTFKRIRNAFETLFYSARTRKAALPEAELLAIAVAASARKQGVAAGLVREGFSLCSRRAIKRLRVLVAADNKPANSLYRMCGFKFAEQITSHNVLSNIYIADIEA